MDSPPLGRKLIVRFINAINQSIAAQNNVRCQQPWQTWTFNSAGPSARVQQERIKEGQENEVCIVATPSSSI